MIELSDFISLFYIAIGVLVLRQIFKNNLLLRCVNCKTFGTLKNVNASEIESGSFFADDNLIDSEYISEKDLWKYEFYKCQKCGQIVPSTLVD